MIKTFSRHDSSYEKYINYGVIALIVLFATASAVYAYRLYTISLEKLAQSSFAVCVKDFDKALQNPTLWPEVELALKTAYYQHRSSSLAPYFLGLEADAFIAQNKMADALEGMKEALKSLTKNSPLWYIYVNKYALMQMDAENTNLKAAGIKQLETLASDEHNTQQDQSLYYLGLHHWNTKNKKEALIIWKKLIDIYGNQELFESQWAQLASLKMETAGAL